MFYGATAIKMEQVKTQTDPREVERLKRLVQLQGDEIEKLTKENKQLREHLEMVEDRKRNPS